MKGETGYFRMKPLIGLNADIATYDNFDKACVNLSYVEAIQRAGGNAIILPPMPAEDLDTIIEKLDGLVFIGGRDYSAQSYGQEDCGKLNILDERREKFDFILIEHALKKSQMPILGICGGCQLLNITLGGSLIQDIPECYPNSHIQHSKPKDFKNGVFKHPVNITEGSQLSSIYAGKERLDVPTSHHQSIDKAGEGLVVSAKADDSVIEAVEMSGKRFVIGVQWHPERDWDNNKLLFHSFMKAAKSN